LTSRQEDLGTIFRTQLKESGKRILLEKIDGITRFLYREGEEDTDEGKYFLETVDKKGGKSTQPISRRRARTLINDMVARILDEERFREERSKGERQ